MKQIHLHILTVLLLYSSARAADLTVELKNPPGTGTVEILLFDSPGSFSNLRAPVRSVKIPAAGQPAYRMTGIPPGEYAVMVHHDENNNGELDKNFIGIPREPVGFANGYSPKGPPSYSRAQLTVTEGASQTLPVELSRPLGERGRIGAGPGIIVRSSPYRDSGSGTFMPIPAVTYTGNRLQIFGPRAQLGLIEVGPLQLAAAAQYRPGAYKEDDSDFLAGMGDRDATLMAGAGIKAALPAGTDLSLNLMHDALNRIGGSEASLFLDRSFELGSVRLTPKAGVNWMSSRLANYDYGVPASKALPGRPAYDTGDVFSLETGISALAELTENWWLSVGLAVEVLSSDVKDSPIVEDACLFKGFFAAQYVF
jgi:outer membrane protein